MGYQQKAIAQAKNNWFCNTFVPCDKTKDTMTLGDIVPSDGISSTVISFLGNDGTVMNIDDPDYGETYATYVYINIPRLSIKGWYLEEDEDLEYPKDGLVVPLGQGMDVYATDDEIGEYFTFNGVVYDQDLPLEITQDKNNWFGNCSPTDITLGDIVPSDGISSTVVSFLGDDGTVMNIDDPDYGETYATYVYINIPRLSIKGWYLEEDEDLEYPKNGLVISAGSSMDVYATDDEIGETLTIPAAL